MNSQNSLRRSPRYHQASTIGSRLLLADITSCARIGFKGVDTVAWLESNQVAVPAQPNEACELDNGGLNARLSLSEFLLVDIQNKDNSTIDSLRSAWSMDIPERSYLLERGDSHACFEVRGDQAAELFSKICGVDLRPHKFANMAIAQTSVAKLNAIVIRVDKGSELNFLLLADICSAEYLWNVVEDAAVEFNQS